MPLTHTHLVTISYPNPTRSPAEDLEDIIRSLDGRVIRLNPEGFVIEASFNSQREVRFLRSAIQFLERMIAIGSHNSDLKYDSGILVAEKQ